MSTFPVLLGVFIFDELVIDKNHTNFATITNTSNTSITSSGSASSDGSSDSECSV